MRVSRVGILALITAGCAAGDFSTPSECVDGKCDSTANAIAIQGPELVRCWNEKGTDTDPFFRLDKLSCELKTIRAVPLRIQAASVDVETRRNVAGKLLDKADTPILVTGLREDDYPVKVKVQVFLTGGDEVLNGLRGTSGTLTELTTRFDIARPDAWPQATPKIIRVPFSFWKLAFLGRTRAATAKFEPRTLALAPSTWREQATITLDQVVAPIVRDGETKVFYLAVANETKELHGTATLYNPSGQKSVAFTLTGPGGYVVEEAGLRRATAAELPSPADGGTTEDGGPTLSPDLAPAKTCGTDGLPRCNVNGSLVCDPGFVHFYSDGLCHACGKDNQPRCYDAAANEYYCDPGFTYFASDNQCHACGKDNQPRCYNDSTNTYSCDPGYVYRFSDNLCHAS